MAEPYGFGFAGTGHARILNGVISRHERPLLLWLARRVPQRVTPNHLTIFGVAGALMTAVALATSGALPHMLWLALAGLGANWAGNSLDGTLARWRRIERPRYGFFVDHLSDLASQIMIVVGLGLSPYLRFDVACLALIGYLVLTIFTLVKLYVFRTMQLTYFGIGPTEVRAVIAGGIMVAMAEGPVNWPTRSGAISLFDGAAIAMLIFALGSAVVMFVRDGMTLARMDPVPAGAADEEANVAAGPREPAWSPVPRIAAIKV